MSQQRPRPRQQVIRRRVRESQRIDLPEFEPQTAVPHAFHHAKTFVAALALVIVGGSLLLSTPLTTESGESTPPIDAFFTAVSATSVTGLVTVDTQDHWNFLGELIILLLIQIGGLGFMVGASLILQMLRRGQTRLRDVILLQNGAPTLSLSEAAELSRRIIVFIFAVEGIGAALLSVRFAADMPVPEAIWHGVFHAVSAFCNAGFDLQGGFLSLQGYRTSLWVNLVIMALVQFGALSYMVFHDVWHTRRWRAFALDTKLVLVVNAVLLLFGWVIFLAGEWSSALAPIPEWERPVAAMFQSVATRTAGFTTIDYAQTHVLTLFTWVALMLIGGASGSTAGGAKLTTFGVVVVAVVSTLRGQEEAQIFGRRIPTPVIFRAMAVIALMFFAHFVATAMLAATEDFFGAGELSFISLMFETMSALATVGLSTGITPSLTDAGKVVLCLVMFFGRLGPLTAAYALQRRQRSYRYRLPEAPVRIG